MSCCSRSLLEWTIWLTANGAASACGCAALPGGQFRRYARQPRIEQFRRPRVQRREAADDAGRALRQHQVGVGDDEQRRADGGQAQALQQRGQGHGGVGEAGAGGSAD
jgi:hypothetical protein